MKIKTTKSQWIALFFSLFGLYQQVQGQACGATNSNNCTLMWYSAVSFKNSAGSTASYQGLNCTNTGSSNKLMTSGAVMDFTPGEQITMTIENTCSYALIAGVWIDLDGDGSFSAAECISKTAGPLGSIASNTTKTATLTIPCAGVKPGKAIMRVRAFYSTMAANQGCGTVATYGNIMDFEVNLNFPLRSLRPSLYWCSL